MCYNVRKYQRASPSFNQHATPIKHTLSSHVSGLLESKQRANEFVRSGQRQKLNICDLTWNCNPTKYRLPPPGFLPLSRFQSVSCTRVKWKLFMEGRWSFRSLVMYHSHTAAPHVHALWGSLQQTPSEALWGKSAVHRLWCTSLNTGTQSLIWGLFRNEKNASRWNNSFAAWPPWQEVPWVKCRRWIPASLRPIGGKWNFNFSFMWCIILCIQNTFTSNTNHLYLEITFYVWFGGFM